MAEAPTATVEVKAKDDNAELVELFETHVQDLEKQIVAAREALKAKDAEIAVLRARLGSVAPAVSGTKAKIRAKSHLVVDGMPVPRGAVVEISSEQAASLIRGGAAEAYTE